MIQRNFLQSSLWFRRIGLFAIIIAFGKGSNLYCQTELDKLRTDKINAERSNNVFETASINEKIGIYFYFKEINTDSSILYFKMAEKQYEEIDSIKGAAYCYQDICFTFYELRNEPDSALYYCNKSVNLWQSINQRLKAANIQKYIGVLLAAQGKISEAKLIINEAINIFAQENYPEGIAVSYFDLAIVYKESQDWDSCYYFATKSREFWLGKNAMERITGLNNFLLATFMENKKYKKIVKKLLETTGVKSN